MASDEQDTQVHYDLGIAYAEMGLVEDAIAELEQAIVADPTHPRAAVARSMIQALRARERGGAPAS